MVEEVYTPIMKETTISGPRREIASNPGMQ
jgi:hypothetical protein